jgi:hypothetical protein
MACTSGQRGTKKLRDSIQGSYEQISRVVEERKWIGAAKGYNPDYDAGNHSIRADINHIATAISKLACVPSEGIKGGGKRKTNLCQACERLCPFKRIY